MSWRGVRGQLEAHYFSATSGEHSACRRHTLDRVFGYAPEAARQCEYCQKLVAVEITAIPIKAPMKAPIKAWANLSARLCADGVTWDDITTAQPYTVFEVGAGSMSGTLTMHDEKVGAPEPVRVSEIVTKLRAAAAELALKGKESAEFGPAALVASRAERNAAKKELAVWRTQARKADKEVERLRLVLANIATTAAMPTARVVELALDALNQTYAPIEKTP